MKTTEHYCEKCGDHTEHVVSGERVGYCCECQARNWFPYEPGDE